MTELEQTIEQFRIDNGFYPPSFEQFSRETTPSSSLADVTAEVSQLLPFLNKMAPNHREGVTPSFDAGRASAGFTLLHEWWVNIGVNLDQRSSHVFWLSGLAQNKQFPLTGGTGALIAAWNDTSAPVERRELFEFDASRLLDVFDANGVLLPNVQAYRMEFGKQKAEDSLVYIYRDAGSYVPGIFNPPSGGVLQPIPYDRFNGNHLALAYHIYDNSGALQPAPNAFPNPESFQLITFGLDADGGVPRNTDGTVNLELRGSIVDQGPGHGDNICNFAPGRLDKFVNDVQ